jgi:ABC-type multidrug transport system ATPase subunit
MYPDKGSIEINGRVSSLIELGAGFHPDMRGKENIYTNASIFGLTKKEIDKRLDDIIAFSELEEFIDNPVRTYSSGMYMRLAFSVAINVDADILLIDEILAVGDANFQAKCFKRLRGLRDAGVTIVLVTHDTGTVEKFCTKAIWLNDGKIVSGGDPVKTVADYLHFMAHKNAGPMPQAAPAAGYPEEESEDVALEMVGEISDEQKNSIDYSDTRFGLRYVEITHVEILDAAGASTNVLQAFEPATIVLSYRRHKDLTGYIFGFSFYAADGALVLATNTQLDKLEISRLKQQGRVTVRIDALPLAAGQYDLQVAVVDLDGIPMDYHRAYCHFDVLSHDRYGLISMGRSWEVD